MHEGVELGKVRYHGRDDDQVQRDLLPCLPIYAQQAREVGSEGVVFGRL